jgi:hypothetical protein
LNYAKKLLDKGMDYEAKERLQKLVKEYPETKAASEAKEMLKKLDEQRTRAAANTAGSSTPQGPSTMDDLIRCTGPRLLQNRLRMPQGSPRPHR